MGRIPISLRVSIGQNIRALRKQKFPGRGGSMKCAEAFGVSPQQWSPWETGSRTPDEIRLADIARFFGVTVEDLRRDNPIGQAADIVTIKAQEPPDRQAVRPETYSDVVAYHDALGRLLNTANFTSLRMATKLMISLAEHFEMKRM